MMLSKKQFWPWLCGAICAVWIHARKKIAWLMSALLLGGCSTVSVDDKGRSVTHNFGYVRLIVPPYYSPQKDEINGEDIDFFAFGVKAVGLRAGSGKFSLGYSATDVVNIPLDCRLVALVQNKEQLERLVEAIDRLQEGQLCAAVSPK